jgi:AAA domain
MKAKKALPDVVSEGLSEASPERRQFDYTGRPRSSGGRLSSPLRVAEVVVSEMPQTYREETAAKNGHAAVMPAMPSFGTFTAEELLAEELPEVRWAVPGIVPEGVTVLAGKPKMGKSWMTLGACVAVVTGGNALGEIEVVQGEALYLALEDNKRRLQRRLDKLLTNGTVPKGLHMATDWPRADEGGIERLDAFLRAHPDCRLVAVDTLARFKPRATGRRTQYDEDRDAVDPLAPLAAEHGVAILLVHHLRESESDDPLDMIHGSAGLTGGVDGALVLKRQRGSADAYLHIDGRDIEQPAELALEFDPDAATWKVMGKADDYRRGKLSNAIVKALENSDEPMSPQDVADALGQKYENVKQRLYQMSKMGEVNQVGRGQYTAL